MIEILCDHVKTIWLFTFSDLKKQSLGHKPRVESSLLFSGAVLTRNDEPDLGVYSQSDTHNRILDLDQSFAVYD